MSNRGDYLANWHTQIRKGLLDYCICKLLSEKEKYGYQLVKELEQLPNLIITEGTIYPILAKLKKEGYLSSQLKDDGSGPARKYYSLTPKGKKVKGEMDDYWAELQKSIKKI